MFHQSLENRSIFVTGHTGFKGSWLSFWLQRLGAEVHGYALEPETDPSLFEASGIQSKLASHTVADVCDIHKLREAIERTQPDVIFHLAAQALVRRSYSESLRTFEVNTMGTANLLEALRQLNRPCAVVVVTTDKCYRNEEQVWGYKESDPLGGDDPYSASKAAAEIVIDSYRKSFFLKEGNIRVASCRGGNVIGGGDWSQDRLVPDLARALNSGETLEIRSPGAIRPWQHVLELLSGYLELSVKLLTTEDAHWASAWNFGPRPGCDIPVSEVVRIFNAAWGKQPDIKTSPPSTLHEANTLRLAIDKSCAHLKWRPTWGISEALQRTAKWYRAFFGGASATDLMEHDLQAFEHALSHPTVIS